MVDRLRPAAQPWRRRMSTAFERLLANPWGPHDPETHVLNMRLRLGPVAGKLVLLSLADGQFALARLPMTRPGSIERLGPLYTDALAGERDILRRRFEALP